MVTSICSPLVLEHIWQETYARVWFPWLYNVLHRFPLGDIHWCRQDVRPYQWHTSTPHHRLAMVLYCLDNNAHRHPAIPLGIPWRFDKSLFANRNDYQIEKIVK